MPLYDYRCTECGNQFEARHGFNDAAPPCPVCGAQGVERLILTAPAEMRGVLAEAGSGGNATKEELRDKWAEETPKLRKKLVDKLGEDTVSRYAPSLNMKYNDQ
ncbi:MAG: hypothetical protein GYB67_02730 [Chloroflexi bacterium]|nr:hypothetical protein [Chloroflexota bacterium]